MPDNLRQVDILHLSNFYESKSKDIEQNVLPFNFEGWGFAEKREIRLFFISFSLQINDKKNTSKFSHEHAAR